MRRVPARYSDCRGGDGTCGMEDELHVLCVTCYNVNNIGSPYYFSRQPVWSSTLERQAGAFAMRRIAMAGIARKRNSLKIGKTIEIRRVPVVVVTKTNGKPKLPVGLTHHQSTKAADPRDNKQGFEPVEINTPRRPQVKPCWCRWTRSPGATASCFDIGVSLNDSTSRSTPLKQSTHTRQCTRCYNKTYTDFFFWCPCSFYLPFWENRDTFYRTTSRSRVRVREIREGGVI